jgi:deoxyhypusine synthase
MTAAVKRLARVGSSTMPDITLDEDTIDRLDRLRVDEESYDEIVTELINIYETEERTLFRGGSP